MIKAEQFKNKRSSHKVFGTNVYCYYRVGSKGRTFFRYPNEEEKQAVIEITAEYNKNLEKEALNYTILKVISKHKDLILHKLL